MINAYSKMTRPSLYLSEGERNNHANGKRREESVMLCHDSNLHDIINTVSHHCMYYSLLRLVRREFIHPAKLGPAVLAHDIAHHVASSEHHSFLNRTEGQIDDTLEEIGTSCRDRD